MRKLFLTFAALAAAAPVSADFGDYRGHVIEDQALVVTTDVGELRITAFDDAAFEVHYVEEGVRQLPSFAITGGPPDVRSSISESEATLAFMIDGLTAVVDKSPVRVSFLKDGEELLAEEHGYFAYDTLRGFRFALDDGEKIMGGGQRVLGMDRRGRRLPLYNKAAYGYTTDDREQMYYGLPAIMSSDRYVIVFDNSANGWIDIGHTENDVLQFEAVGGRTSYIVIAGDTYPELVGNYTDVTGRQPLPPRWTFGNYASRFGYRSEEQVRDVVKRFKDADIPLDAVILDIYWFGPEIQGYMGNLDWDREAWPTAEDMIADFRDEGIRTIAITEPFVLTTSTNWQSAVDAGALALNATGLPKTFDFYFGNTGLVDVFNESARDWFWQFYERLFEQGTAGTWGDLGEPEVHPADSLHFLSDAGITATADEIHNAYGHLWAKMVFDKQVDRFPDMRPVVMMRSGFAGSQRYGMIPWTGDVDRSWGGLGPQVELALQMGLFGLGYIHSDLGGFAGGDSFDSELYTRWLQYGVFQPIYRPHAQEHIPPEPVFHDAETMRLARDAIRLRYSLLPYIYTLAWENATTGMPLMRPLFFEDELDQTLIDEKNAYLWGDAFLVAPVVEPGVSDVEVNLPRGTWFDFWNGTRYLGGQTASIPVTIETIPVLVRAGSFVPRVDPVDTTENYSSEKLSLHYYADSTVTSASGRMYEDDGKSRTSIEDGEFEILSFDAKHSGDSLTISLRRETNGYSALPAARELTLVVHNWSAPVTTISFNGESVSGSLEGNTLTVPVTWDHSASTLQINEPEETTMAGKPVVYQVFTRLFGNTETTNKPWGTIEENGVGKFTDFTPEALAGIREFGTTHIWYTGVPHHAVIRDYKQYGISDDDPDVVKGRAGSPYAVKDYYSVNPDLAIDPARRMEEFEELIRRTHDAGMKVIIDIVPNHVARGYESLGKPDGVEDFGAGDDTAVAWARDNNFYYVPGKEFRVPESPRGYAPLGGERHPLADGRYEESPARWTGNGAREARPKFDDWFETVKVNYGVRPDGSYAFDTLPDEARGWSIEQHAAFWAGRDVPDSWTKFREIVTFWLNRGVDGFRFDMAEMVPVEFWSFLNSSIKRINPDAFLLAEVYNPSLYRDYLHLGRMDYLYDKVGFYDTLKPIMQGKSGTDALAPVHAEVLDIEEHMLHFLENHDEQRIASEPFAGDARKGMPAMTVSALISRSPSMLYFGQDVGERGDGDAGFGDPTRTTIFDYWGVPAHQRWMNDGAFDGGQLSDAEKELRDFYVRLMSFSASNPALLGEYAEVHSHNRQLDTGYDDRLFAFVRWQDDERLIVVSNFDDTKAYDLELQIPAEIIATWGLGNGRYALEEQLYGDIKNAIVVDHGLGKLPVQLEPLQSVVYRVGDGMFLPHETDRFVDDLENSGVKGTLLTWKNVESEFLDEPRHVQIWLPPDYEENADLRYRVIYMADGQNVFDPRIASWGIDWGIDEAMVRGAEAGLFEPAIVVAAWSTADRTTEYSPWHDAGNYARFLIEELMPRVNAEFRTLTGPENTSALGASSGALLGFGLVRDYPEAFGACGCVSPHFALSDDDDPKPYVVRDIEGGAMAPRGARFYFDYGTETLDATYHEDHEPVREWLVAQGFVEGEDFRMKQFEGHPHNETAWRSRLIEQLEWMLGRH